MPYKALLWIITRAPGLVRARKYLRSPKEILATPQAIEAADLETVQAQMRERGMVPCLDKLPGDPTEVCEVWVARDKSPSGFVGEYASTPSLDPLNERQTVYSGTQQARHLVFEGFPGLPVETVSGFAAISHECVEPPKSHAS